MSKNIVIQEGGIGKQLTADKLKTDLVGGGSCLWVPEDEVLVGTKHITQNGTYEASADNLYGYNTITVDVPGGAGGSAPGSSGTPGGIGSTIVGTDPVTGEEQAITVDENGELVTTRLPEKIAVTTRPTKTEYTDGQTINPTGIIVHAYYGDDSDYGTVLNSELSYDPTISQFDYEYSMYASKDGIVAAIFQCTIPYGNNYHTDKPLESHTARPSTSNKPSYDYIYTDKECIIYLTMYNGAICVCSNKSITGQIYITLNEDGSGWFGKKYGLNLQANTFIRINTYSIPDTIPESLSDPTMINFADPEIVGYTQTVTVKWPRIIDHKELTTTFDIVVTAAQENEGNESSGSGESEGGGGGHSF